MNFRVQNLMIAAAAIVFLAANLVRAENALASDALGASSPAAKTAAPKSAPAPAPVASKASGEPVKAGFDILGGYPFTTPAYDAEKPDEPIGPRVDEQIPSAVRELNGRVVAVTGFMLPTRMVDGGRVTEFLLMRDQLMCCFGVQPQMNEWIVVKLAKSAVYMADVPKTFTGKLHVGAVVENGYMSGIYLLEEAKPSS